MRMELQEYMDFMNIRYIYDKLPPGVRAELFFNSEQREGPAIEGPWSGCWLFCSGFKSLEEANLVWSFIERHFEVDPNSNPPGDVADETIGFRVLLERHAVRAMH